MKQLVFKQIRNEPFDINNNIDNCSFVFCTGHKGSYSLLFPLLKGFGLSGTLKIFLKLMTGNRFLYCVMLDGIIVNHAWVTLSWCRHYSIEKGSVVIGPVITLKESRGRGLASYGIMNAINALLQKEINTFYIDTSENNAAMQRVIEKCGFGNHIMELTDYKP